MAKRMRGIGALTINELEQLKNITENILKNITNTKANAHN